MPRKKKYKNGILQSYIEGKTALLYVKMPAYIRIWYAAKYGVPVVLRENHPAISIMRKSIRSTGRKAWSETSTMSEDLWGIASSHEDFDRSQWLPFVMPSTVIRNDREVEVDSSWDMYYSDIRDFKEELSYDFWNSAVDYVSRMQIRNKEDGDLFRIDWTLSRFCAENGIKVDYYEQVRRQYYRFVKENLNGPSEIREVILNQRNENLRPLGEGVRFQMLKFLDAE